jgi:hypothetical protein
MKRMPHTSHPIMEFLHLKERGVVISTEFGFVPGHDFSRAAKGLKENWGFRGSGEICGFFSHTPSLAAAFFFAT